jgi:hypothetical protein
VETGRAAAGKSRLAALHVLGANYLVVPLVSLPLDPLLPLAPVPLPAPAAPLAPVPLPEDEPPMPLEPLLPVLPIDPAVMMSRLFAFTVLPEPEKLART